MTAKVAVNKFSSEHQMMPSLLLAADSLCVDGRAPWLVLEQHRVHSRIADLVLARVNPDALEERLSATHWHRPLNETELRALRSLRRDRGTRLATLAERMGAPEGHARRVASRLVSEAYADRTASGSYARLAPVRPIVDWVVSFEAKRADARRGVFAPGGRRPNWGKAVRCRQDQAVE